MDKSRLAGWLICIACVVLAVVFLWGIALQSYWAIAIPVIVALLGVLLVAFWIGWTMAVTEAEAPKPQPKDETPSS